MAFDFPASPSEGAVYTPAGGPSYTYSSGVWRVLPPAMLLATSTASVSDTPPTNPVNGQIWWESDSGATFIWYEETPGTPSTGQWVQQSDTSIPEAPVDSLRYIRKNGVWTSIGPGSSIYAEVAGAANIPFTIPAGATQCRLSGYMTPNAVTTGNHIMMRVSKNSGVSYLTGATDYSYQALTVQGTTLSGSTANANGMYLSGAGGSALVQTRMVAIDCVFNTQGTQEIIQATSVIGAYSGGSMMLQNWYSWCNTVGLYTNFYLCHADNSLVYGKVLAEFNA